MREFIPEMLHPRGDSALLETTRHDEVEVIGIVRPIAQKCQCRESAAVAMNRLPAHGGDAADTPLSSVAVRIRKSGA